MNKKLPILILTLALCAGILSACSSIRHSPYGDLIRVGDLNIARANHSATLLKDGRVLIAGGEKETEHGCCSPILQSEFYDPKTRQFTLGPSFNQGHVGLSTGVTLSDGRIVFIAAPGDNAEIYNPKTNQFTLSGRMLMPRQGAALALLKDGTILVVGGKGNRDPVGAYWKDLNTAEIFNPKTGQFTETGSMHKPLPSPLTIPLDNGSVAVLNKEEQQPHLYDTIEIFNKDEHKFTLLNVKLLPKFYSKIFVLPGERVLEIGGYINRDAASMEQHPDILALKKGAWKPLAIPLRKLYSYDAAIPIDENKLLMLAFWGGCGGFCSFYTKELYIYDILAQRSVRLPDMLEGRSMPSLTKLQDGSILISGGYTDDEHHKSSELLIPAKQ